MGFVPVMAQSPFQTGSNSVGGSSLAGNSGSYGSKSKSTGWGRDTTDTERKIPVGLYQWHIDERLGTVLPAVNRDTVVLNFQNWRLSEGMKGEFSNTGNTGSPGLNRIFTDRQTESQLIFLSDYSYFRRGISDFFFSNTKSPITNLAYHARGNKSQGEDRVRGYFATNINRRAGLGFKLDYLYARGYYQNQQQSQFGGIVYGYYQGDRYQMHAWINANHLKSSENGGITNDQFITDPETASGGRSFDTRDIDVSLDDTYNRNDDQTYFLTHRFNMGYYKIREVPDSLKPKEPTRNEFILQLSDSLRDIALSDTLKCRLLVDSLRQKWQSEIVLPKDFIPVASLIHTLEINHAEHEFYDDAPSENASFYTNQYFGDTFSGSDMVRYLAVRYTVGISMNEGFRRWVKMGLAFFATHQYRRYGLPYYIEDCDSLGNAVHTENDFLIGGQLSKRQGHFFRYEADGEVCMIGSNVGDFNVKGMVDFNFRFTKRDSLLLNVRAQLKNTKPAYFIRHYQNQYVRWDNDDLSRQFTTKVCARLSYPRTHTTVRFGFDNVVNYTYFQMKNTLIGSTPTSPTSYSHDIQLLQTPSVQVFTIGLEQNLAWKIMHLDTDVTFQKSTNEDALPLPALNIYSNAYLLFNIARVLRCQMGADVRLFTRYYAPDYYGAAGMYALQDPNNERIKLGLYPMVNAYVNFFLKHVRFYVNMVNVNTAEGNRFMVPHQPLNGMTLNIGLSWNFFN